MDELIAKLQREFESDLEYFLPEHTTPYFERGQLVSGLLLAAHRYALGVAHKIVNDHYVARPVVVLAAPNANGDIFPGKGG